MCGFSIYRDFVPTSNVDHRGTSTIKGSFADWQWEFASLPLSSNNTGAKLPAETPFGLLFFNGEIFNYQELGKTVLKKTCLSDVHFLVELVLKVKGDMEALRRQAASWDGFWSIAIIRKNSNVEFFTDWIGKKQLYYSKHGISSEIKPILPLDYLVLGYTENFFNTHKTPFTSVLRAMPGHAYVYEIRNSLPYSSGSDVTMFWDKPESFDVVQMIDKSVALRTENRIDQVSIFLSGGLDSNVVLHHLRKHVSNFEAISIDNGEREHVEQLANTYGINVRFISDEWSDKDMHDAVRAYEHPLDYGSLLANWLLFKSVTNSMVLTGDGSDELFGGYDRAKESDTLQYDLAELAYYHNVRLDRTSMAFTKEARSPLMANPLVRMAPRLNKAARTGKQILRLAYRGEIPDSVIDGRKVPLRLDQDKSKYKFLVRETFLNQTTK